MREFVTKTLDLHKLYTDTFLSAEKKKRSISGEENNAIGDRLMDKHTPLEVTLLFLGAGGHVNTWGILNFFAFGVQQPFDEDITFFSVSSTMLRSSLTTTSVFSTEEEVLTTSVANSWQ